MDSKLRHASASASTYSVVRKGLRPRTSKRPRRSAPIARCDAPARSRSVLPSFAGFGTLTSRVCGSSPVVPYAVSKGKLVTVDPDVYVVLDEKLFLFSNADARTAFENEEPGIVQVADDKWAEMVSERAQKKGCFSCF